MTEPVVPEGAPIEAPAPARPKIKPTFWFGLIVLAGFLVFGLSAFKKTLTPYVSFQEARKAKTVVQVAGGLVKGSDSYDSDKKELHFTIIDDKNEKMTVVYAGVRPGNFADAVSIVAIGKYEAGGIRAEKLLVKCPSKYQGEEVEKSYPSQKSS